MARPLRIEYPGAVYPVMNRSLTRQTVFRNPTDYETFLQVSSDTHALLEIEVVREGGRICLNTFSNFYVLNQFLAPYPAGPVLPTEGSS